ncbi:MAG: hypothetical protein PUF36_10300, partial [Prevotella sp.]|nr:hypothetical protein [Prevotella sp.]
LTVCVNNLFVSAVPFSGKRVQRYCFFSELPKLLGIFFRKICVIRLFVDVGQWKEQKTGRISGGNAPDTGALLK